MSRSFRAAAVACLAALLLPDAARAGMEYFTFEPPPGMTLSDRPLKPLQRRPAWPEQRFMRQVVAYNTAEPAGTIVVNTGEKYLYLVLGNGRAMRYGIGTARTGFEWSGTHRVSSKREWPGWTPPAEMKQRQPYLPDYMPGGIDNPLGARAIYIGSTLYRIHGTNEPWTIGHDVSSGCIRLTNDDVEDLYERVKIGARVIVL